jgi:hypothetical protein
MEADGHGVPMATHMVVKRGQIIGAFSVGAAVLVMGWAHTQRAKTRDSMIALNVVENLIGATPGAPRTIIVPVSEESPFAPHMEALGYEDLGPMRLWAKKVG